MYACTVFSSKIGGFTAVFLPPMTTVNECSITFVSEVHLFRSQIITKVSFVLKHYPQFLLQSRIFWIADLITREEDDKKNNRKDIEEN